MKNPGCLWAVGAFFGLLLVGFVSSKLFAPQKLASAKSCIGNFSNAEPPLQNLCDYPVNMQLCLFSKTSDDICRTLTLQPGEGFDRAAIDADLARLDGLLRAETYACKLPYRPGMVENWNTKRMQQGCLPKGETAPR